MATLNSDVNILPLDPPNVGEPSSSFSSSRKPNRFEIKKWNAVTLWAWGIECQANQASATSEECTVAWGCAIMHFIFTASAGGLKLGKFVL